MRPMIDSSSVGERRAYPRYSDSIPVFVSDGVIVLRCTLLDVSQGGVRIAIGDVGRISQTVTLIDPRSGLSHRARTVWRSDGEAGFRFIGEGVRYRVINKPDDLRRAVYRRAS